MFHGANWGRPQLDGLAPSAGQRRDPAVPGRPTMNRVASWRRVVGLGLAALLSACASGGSEQGSASPFAQSRPTTVRLLVQNRNFSDARLYTYRRGARQALGIVIGKQDREFTFEWSAPDPLRIEIDMLAGPRCTTEEMQVDPGDILELQIEPVFTSSSCR